MWESEAMKCQESALVWMENLSDEDGEMFRRLVYRCLFWARLRILAEPLSALLLNLPKSIKLARSLVGCNPWK